MLIHRIITLAPFLAPESQQPSSTETASHIYGHICIDGGQDHERQMKQLIPVAVQIPMWEWLQKMLTNQ